MREVCLVDVIGLKEESSTTRVEAHLLLKKCGTGTRELDELTALSSFNSAHVNKKEFNRNEIEEILLLAKLVDMFHVMDKDSSGSIDKAEIISAMHNLGYKVTQRQAELMLKKVDTDGNSEISLKEFTDFFQKSPISTINSLAEQWTDGIITDFGGELTPSLPPSGLELWQTVVAGGCGGVASRTLTAPLEKVKLAAQTGTSSSSGIFQEMSHIVSQQGVKGLFAGNFMNCLRVFPTAGIACTCYLNLLSLTPADAEFDAMEPVYRLSCGGVAALFANTLTYPMDVIRVRMTLAKQQTSPLQATREVLAKGGVANLYRGLKPTLFAVVPFIALQNTTIDLLRDHLMSEKGVTVSPLLLGGVGAVAGIVAQTVVFPLDVLRRQLQMTNNVPDKANKEVLSDQMWTSVRHLVKKGGVKSLFAGLVPTFMKTIPAIAVVSSVTGSLNGYFKTQNAKQHQ